MCVLDAATRNPGCACDDINLSGLQNIIFVLPTNEYAPYDFFDTAMTRKWDSTGVDLFLEGAD
jgi:hypothetical protein